MNAPYIVAWNHSNIKCYYYSFDGLIKFIRSCGQCFYDWNIQVFNSNYGIDYEGNFGLYCEDHSELFSFEEVFK